MWLSQYHHRHNCCRSGSVYRKCLPLFRNKKEMLLAALAYHYENCQKCSGTPDSSLRSFSSPEYMLAYVLRQFYGLHRKYYALHEELESLRHIDPDVRDAYHRILLDAVNTLVQKCPPPPTQEFWRSGNASI